MKLYRPSELLGFLSSLNKKPSKALSQNFLIDKNIIDKITLCSDISDDDIILEIGPGPGVITNQLLQKAKKVIVVEKDDVFAKNLKESNSQLEVINSDFIKLDLDFLKNLGQKIKVISSIPYHLTSPIIAKLLNNHDLFSSITLMIQKEMAERIVSRPNTKTYSSFSLFVNFYADTKIISNVSKNSFFPKPKVDSAIIKLTIKKKLEDIEKATFHKMVQISFSQRRKKLLTCLKSICEKDKLDLIFKELKINPMARAENLSLSDYLALFKKLF